MMLNSYPRSVYLRCIAVFFVLLFLGGWAIYTDSLQYLEKQKKVALQIANAEVGILSQNLNSAISLAYTLETLLVSNGFKIDQQSLEFYAPLLLHHKPAVSSLQYAPQGIVSYICPLAGNEAAIGHNLLEDNRRNKEAFDAVRKKTLTLAGPFELIQGGEAVVARLPIFRPEAGQDRFWGFSTVLIRIDHLFESSTIKGLSGQGYDWNIFRIHPDTKSPQVFYGPTDGIISDAVVLTMNVPNAQWFVSLKPSAGWLSGFYLHLVVESFLLLAVAVAFAFFFFVYQRQPFALQQEIELRTHELQNAKNILETSENRLRRIAENEEMWIWEVNADGLYTYCGQACEKLFGYSAEEIVGKKHFYDLFHPEHRDALKEAAFKAFRKKESFRKFQNHNVDRAGNTVWLSTSGVPVVDDHDNLVGYVGADVDITKQVEAEESRRNMEAQAIRSSQLATLGELAAGVAHEINNPISGVINYAEILLKKAAANSREEDLSRRIIKEGDRIATIVSQLLSFSRKEDSLHRLHDIKELIDVPMSLVGKKLKKDGIKVEVSIAVDAGQVQCNAQQIEQVILNLLNNSQYSLNKKSPKPFADKRIQINVQTIMREDQPYLLMEVTDFGIGIPGDVLPEIFTAFFTTKEVGVGTGLGLSISENIIKLHGGNMRIDSEEGVYAKVTIELPIKRMHSTD